jgi:hypothetical protein
MKYDGKAYVKATLNFKGNVDLVLWNDMKIEEVIADIIQSGEYEYEVVKGDLDIQDVEPVSDWEDFYEGE